MKVILQIPLFLVVLIIYNIALVATRDTSQAETSAQTQAAPAAQAGTAPEGPATAPPPVTVPGNAGAEGQAILISAPGEAAAGPAAGSSNPAAAPAPSAPVASSPASATQEHPLDRPLFHLPLPSKAQMPVTTHEFLLILAVFFLYVELFKSTRTGNATIVEHVLSLLVFMAFFVELIVYRPAGTPTFLIMTLLAFLDVIAGFTITISTARRDFGVGAHASEAA